MDAWWVCGVSLLDFAFELFCGFVIGGWCLFWLFSLEFGFGLISGFVAWVWLCFVCSLLSLVVFFDWFTRCICSIALFLLLLLCVCFPLWLRGVIVVVRLIVFGCMTMLCTLLLVLCAITLGYCLCVLVFSLLWVYCYCV